MSTAVCCTWKIRGALVWRIGIDTNTYVVHSKEGSDADRKTALLSSTNKSFVKLSTAEAPDSLVGVRSWWQDAGAGSTT